MTQTLLVHNLSAQAVRAMPRVDLAEATEEPPTSIEPFEFHGCHCAVASFIGSPPWEFHGSGDELLHVLSGRTRLTVRQTGSEIVRELAAGDLAVVPKGCWHRNEAPDGVTMLFMTPSDGNQHSWKDPDR